MSRFWRYFIGNGVPRQGTQLEQDLWEVCETSLTVGPGDEEERHEILVAALGKLLQEYQEKRAVISQN